MTRRVSQDQITWAMALQQAGAVWTAEAEEAITQAAHVLLDRGSSVLGRAGAQSALGASPMPIATGTTLGAHRRLTLNPSSAIHLWPPIAFAEQHFNATISIPDEISKASTLTLTLTLAYQMN